MKIPVIKGVIDRRMLVNFTADPGVVQKLLPQGFRPKLYKEKAIAGICLIRLKQIRIKGFPAFMGISSENGAHRIAVEWEENGEWKEGVFIPRRDTNFWFNAMVGGRVFPGRHYRAAFDVVEGQGKYHVAFKSSDGTSISVDAEKSEVLDQNSIFGNLENASEFFKAGSLGYSPNKKKLEGMRLNSYKWEMQALKVNRVASSFFENEMYFPKGSIQFDNALLMTNIEHEWNSAGDKPICD
jgi:hypothetical protein